MYNAHSLKLDESSLVPWVIDVGASDHIISTPHLYIEIISNTASKTVLLNGKKVSESHAGMVKMSNK